MQMAKPRVTANYTGLLSFQLPTQEGINCD
nr:MAG TPA: hypothetical protein [Caudoviricetes sp.]DAS97817.1 MAG TPA: hypothetical protein [Bacteriophage sp.]